MKHAIAKQPAPKPGKEVVLDLVIGRLEDLGTDLQKELIPDLKLRAAWSMQHYNTPLMTHNGRNALAEAYQEALDGIMYLTQMHREIVDYQPNYHLMLVIRDALRNQINVAAALKYIILKEQKRHDSRDATQDLPVVA